MKLAESQRSQRCVLISLTFTAAMGIVTLLRALQ
jgi:hypothetical protein